MQLTNSSIVDYSSDGTSATLTTDLAVNSKTSGITGLKISTTKANTTNGGYRYCTKCGGAGGYNEMYMDQYLSSNRQHKQVSKYRWRSCPVCGGSGHVK
jgi:calcineurin-like phosphoesterase